MSGGAKALFVAIDNFSVPSRVHRAKQEPLPEGVELLLRIVSGDEEALREASAASGRADATVRWAAEFFVEQILFAPEVDFYRMLGADARARPIELRRNMALLSRWIHPDTPAGRDFSHMATRLTEAWNNVKTPERRAAYDLARARQQMGMPRDRFQRSESAQRSSVGGHAPMRHSVSGASGPPGARPTHGGRGVKRILKKRARGGIVRRFVQWLWWRWARSSQ